ncbi:MAG: DUF4388 domain-containing protein [Myxococcota bacterium]
MRELDDPLSTLRRLSERGSSGELVAAGDELEVHVHLHRGRIAWATSSASTGMLVSYLLEHCEIDRDALTEIVAECRRTRKRFGETLVEWGVARPEQVRAALSAQIRDALASLEQVVGLRTLFLPRDSVYDEALTFAIGEVCGEGGHPEPCVGRQLEEMGERVLRTVPEASWVRVVSPDAVLLDIGTQGPGDRQFLRSTSEALHWSAASSATLRCDRGALVGRSLFDLGAWAWCGLGQGANLGLAKAVLSSVVPRGSVRPPPALSPEWVAYPKDGALPTFPVLEQAMDRSEELLSAMVFDPEGVRFTVVHRLGFDSTRLVDQVSRLVGPMRSSLASFFVPGDHPSIPQTQLHMEDEHFAHFGTSLTDGHGPYLWLVLQRSGSPGFGWALLTTLARQVGEQVASGSKPGSADAEAPAGVSRTLGKGR